MQTISIVEGTSDLFGEKDAKTVSFQTTSARMDFVIKEGNHCSVSYSLGTGKEIKELTFAFIERHQPSTLVNQVSRDIELRAMYTCGLRLPIDIGLQHEIRSMNETSDYLKGKSSVLVALNGITREAFELEISQKEHN